jgi:hypothetical protein
MLPTISTNTWYRRVPAALRVARWLVMLALATLPAARAAEVVPPAAAAPAAEAAPAPTHRPLRENQPPAMPEPTEPETFSGYAGAPPFTVVPRKPQLALYPCSQCHKALPVNTKPRKLTAAPHPAALVHGKGRMWCTDCHLAGDRDWLHTVNNSKVDFNDSPLLCGQCHSARHKDWTFGGHGKRVAGWGGAGVADANGTATADKNGKPVTDKDGKPVADKSARPVAAASSVREIYACTHCHDPHNPLIAPRAPGKAPPVRAGLTPMVKVHDEARQAWQRVQPGNSNAPKPHP